jgi:hypothetical protein
LRAASLALSQPLRLIRAHFMRSLYVFVLGLSGVLLLLLLFFSPRDFLTHRLAADLIAGSTTFRSRQELKLRTGVLPNQEYISPSYLALQHRGWISATNAACPSGVGPPPCWDVMLTPSGVETMQSLIAPGDSEKKSFSIPAARRELIGITGVAKQGKVADVEFTWKWVPLNEVGAAIYAADIHYHSSVGFRNYDDGWRVVESAVHPGQSLNEALENAEPTQ